MQYFEINEKIMADSFLVMQFVQFFNNLIMKHIDYEVTYKIRHNYMVTI